MLGQRDGFDEAFNEALRKWPRLIDPELRSKIATISFSVGPNIEMSADLIRVAQEMVLVASPHIETPSVEGKAPRGAKKK